MESIIKIHLKDKKDYQNNYNKDILSHKLRNYILDELKGIDTDLKMVVTSDFEMTDEDKNKFNDMIRSDFGTDISDIMKLSKKQNRANILIFFIGLIFLLLYSFLEVEFLSEFVLILGWVFLGEAICNFFYNGIENRMKIKKRKKIVKAKITFE